MGLMWLRLFTWGLELNEERPTARHPEYAVWVTGAARCDQL